MNEVLIIMEKYKEVLEKAKTLYNMLSDKGEKSHLEELFPELKELDDNKTWKELFEFIDKASGGYLNSAIPCEKFQKWRKWLVDGQFLNSDIVKYIRQERNKIGFHYQGKEVSWVEIPRDVRRRDYSCYFKEDLDCYPFDVEKLYVQNPFSGISFHYDGHVWGMCARDHGVDILCDSKPMNHITLEQEVSNESGDDNNGPVGYGKFIDEKLNEASRRYFADNSDPDKYSLADVFYAGIRCERAMKEAISIRDRELLDTLIEDYSNRSLCVESNIVKENLSNKVNSLISLKTRLFPED